MHYVVTVTEVTQPPDGTAKDILTCERFKQHFPEPFDLNKFVLALNQKPRGRRPATKPAKEAK